MAKNSIEQKCQFEDTFGFLNNEALLRRNNKRYFIVMLLT